MKKYLLVGPLALCVLVGSCTTTGQLDFVALIQLVQAAVSGAPPCTLLGFIIPDAESIANVQLSCASKKADLVCQGLNTADQIAKAFVAQLCPAPSATPSAGERKEPSIAGIPIHVIVPPHK